MQEGDIQIKGYPLRLPLDVLLVFTANPEDYTARGKIITPLKDRIGAEIRTHYPANVEEGMRITEQEAWTDRGGQIPVEIPDYIRAMIEQIAFIAREDKRVDKRSGVSQRLPISVLESVVSSAEQRAVRLHERPAVTRVTDVYAALPSITGKVELEYEGELRGADTVAREMIRGAIGRVFDAHFSGVNLEKTVEWFQNGGELKLPSNTPSKDALALLRKVPGLVERLDRLGLRENESPVLLVAGAEFLLEGLWAHRRINRSEERGYHAEAQRPAEPREGEPFVGRPPRRQFN
jgi:magnesium chelatase subunit I